MKFLLFNLVVAGALIYLFTADRADVRAAADRVYETADDIKSVARNAVGQGRKLLQGNDAPPAHPVPPPEAAPAPAPVKQVARSISPPVLSPEVARRRDEVLGLAAPASNPETKQGENFMSSAQRQQELVSLAEEMELFYARKISQ